MVGAAWTLIERGAPSCSPQWTSGRFGSESMMATRSPRSASPSASSSAAVVLPAPPLGLMNATFGTLVSSLTIFGSRGAGPESSAFGPRRFDAPASG